jgi:hypothetical protein
MMNNTVVDYTPASRLVRADAKKRLGVYAFVFNDRLKSSGGRSIKIWGAGKSFYTPIKRKLEKMGYKVTLKNLGKNRIRADGRDCYRIHVL